MSDVLYGRAFVDEFGRPSSSKREGVDAAPFLGWLDRWQRDQGRGREAGRYMGAHDAQDGRAPAGLGELAELAGVSERAFRRIRSSGRVSITVVDRVLIAAGGNTMLCHLYPEH